MAHSGSAGVASDARVLDHYHALVDQRGTLVEVLAVCDLLLQVGAVDPKQLTNLDIVGTNTDIKVLKLQAGWRRRLRSMLQYNLLYIYVLAYLFTVKMMRIGTS